MDTIKTKWILLNLSENIYLPMFSEKIFEDILVKYPELIEAQLKFIGRQVQYFGKRIDILFEDRFNEKLIVELKKDNLNRNALSQVLEYEGYILSEKDPTARVMLIANRIPLNLKKAMDHHGIEYKEITKKQLLEFIENKENGLFNLMTSTERKESVSSMPIFTKNTMAGKLDEILHQGGTWEELIKKAKIESDKRKGKIKYTKGVLNAHIKYRTITQKNSDYLKGYMINSTGILPKNPSLKIKSSEIIGTVTNIKAKRETKDRFEIWISKKSADKFPYEKTSNPEGLEIKIKLEGKIYPIGFHYKSYIWLSSRMDRDGYNLTDLLKSHGIKNNQKLILTPLDKDLYELTRVSDHRDLNLDL
ncbi:MAG: endonuclease NucS [Atribacterota bacterium]|nr:endonuclease NucS [Atribacterota bacterium]